jgi:hypothetical protein
VIDKPTKLLCLAVLAGADAMLCVVCMPLLPGRLVLLMVDAQAAREQLKQRLSDGASSTAASQQQQPASEQ